MGILLENMPVNYIIENVKGKIKCDSRLGVIIRHYYREQILHWQDTLYPQEKRRILKALLKEVDYNGASKKLGIILNGSDLRLEFDVDLKQVRPLNKWHKEIEIEKEPKIRKNLILAYQLQHLLDEGKIQSPKQAAQWLNTIQVRIDQIMNMLLLSPAIQEEIICSENKALNLIPEYKLRSITNEVDWQKQGQMWQDLLQIPS